MMSFVLQVADLMILTVNNDFSSFLAEGGALEATQLMQCCNRSDCWHKKHYYCMFTLNAVLIQPTFNPQHAYIHQAKGCKSNDNNNPFFLSLHIL